VPGIDVVIVSYRSGPHLHRCAELLAGVPGVGVTVCDNASPDEGPERVADLPIDLVRNPRNGGLAYGCNVGWRRGAAPYVCFLHPDAELDPSALAALVATLERHPEAGIVGPRIVDAHGTVEPSARRFPRLASSLAQAVFLHRVAPRARWTDEVIHDPALYAHGGEADWISGACMLVRRTLLEHLGGFDEGYFLDGADVDLCRRARNLGFAVRVEGAAEARRVRAASAPRSTRYPVLAASRLRYARKHEARLAVPVHRLTIGLDEAAHAVASPSRAARAEHLRALLAIAGVSSTLADPRRSATHSPARPPARSPALPEVPRTYAVITPARDELENLPRLAASLAAQPVKPEAWYIVENGSTDGTPELCARLAEEHPWIRILATSETAGKPVRGGPVVRAVHAAVDAGALGADVIVKVDADVSFEPDHFARLLTAFADEPGLGMASGSCWERSAGIWTRRHVTGSTVWGAARAYRRECLHDVLPLDPRMAWDGIDEMRANAAGWRTGVILDLPFRHHRPEGVRDGSARRARMAQGRAAHSFGYRPAYLVLRSLHHARREPAALAMIWGYAAAAARRAPQLDDQAVRAELRARQSMRNVPRRAREALGRRGA
jgi:N-acetylglucosaminyl-diphospho-decaprenol L-rhamnosyltransferase